jgi:ribosome-associated protein
MKMSGVVQGLATALDEAKGIDIQVLDVRGRTSFADYLVIASGRSDRHVRALAERTTEFARDAGLPTLGTEGARQGDWVLVDLGDIVVHLMHPTARAYYQLEKLWDAESRAGSRRR